MQEGRGVVGPLWSNSFIATELKGNQLGSREKFTVKQLCIS
jgi:hypothetical protein